VHFRQAIAIAILQQFSRKHDNFHQTTGITRLYIEITTTRFKKGCTAMKTRTLTQSALAAAVALTAITSVSTASFAAERHYRHHHLRYGYAHGFRPDVNIPGTAGNRPYYNAPGASPLDPCGDICDSAITGGGA
jgi:uncharacterized membrane protein